MFKPELALVNLFVENPPESAAFYRKLLELEPVMQEPTFVMFVLPNGLKLGLWSKATVEPAATGTHGSFELSFIVDDVDAVYESWKQQGITILQKPLEMAFGRNFLAADPDGHRIRVYKLRERK